MSSTAAHGLLQRPVSVDAETERDLRNFLYFEAELLDDWRFRDWLELLDEGIEYTMPTQANALTRVRRNRVKRPSMRASSLATRAAVP